MKKDKLFINKINFVKLLILLPFFLCPYALPIENKAILSFPSTVQPMVATKGMVATQESRATEVGLEALNLGGNAVDAAVAIGFALAVTLPRAGNLGGGGFMMIYDQKNHQIKALDYREKAPKKSTRDMYLNWRSDVDNNKSRYSVLSAGVPGTVAGLLEAHEKYGKLPLSQVMQPAINLAKNLSMTFSMAESLNRKRDYLSKSEASIATYFKSDGSDWTINDSIKQLELAEVLKSISLSKGKSFYQGKIAKKIIDFIQSQQGIMTLADLKSYKTVWRKPVETNFAGSSIYSMPPPSSGGIHLIQLLNILKHFDIKTSGVNTADSTHIITEAMKFAYADRSRYLGDPDFVNIPVKKLLSPAYAKIIATKISKKRVLNSKEISPGRYLSQESPQTTHFSVIDKDGNMVSNTYTLNFSFGSGITVPGTGILLNNEMDDFSSKPGVPNGYGLLGGEANSIESEKRPLSSMTPVIVLNKSMPWLATGSPGGSRIITIVLNFLLNKMVHGMNIASATLTPRFHHQWYPETLMLEKGFPIDSANILKAKGHNIKFYNPWGSLQTVEYHNGLFYGFSDSRRPGALAKGNN